MIFIESINMGVQALLATKLRSSLTVSGITIGISGVLAMVAIGDGAKKIILQDLEKIGGINMFTLVRVSSKSVAGHRIPIRSGEYFNYADALALQTQCPSVKFVTPRLPEWTRVLMQAPDGTNLRAGYNGVDESYHLAMEWNLKTGRFISATDVKNATKVVSTLR